MENQTLKYFEMAYEVIKNEFEETQKKLQENLGDKRLSGESSGLAFALGVVSQSLKFAKEEKYNYFDREREEIDD